MSKYIIEIDDDLSFDPQFLQVIGAEPTGNVRIRHVEFDDLEELDYDHINENLDRIQNEAYQRGLNDAWEAARKIVTWPDRSLINSDTFDLDHGESIFTKYSASEAIAKLKAYEEQKADDEIKVGDEVEIKENGAKFFVTKIYEKDGTVCGLNEGGEVRYCLRSLVKRTDRHFDIDKILEEMKE